MNLNVEKTMLEPSSMPNTSQAAELSEITESPSSSEWRGKVCACINESSKAFDGFLFLPSFRESIDNLMDATPDLASELLWSIIIYGTQNKEISCSPAIKAIMASIRRTIDAGKEKRDRRAKKESKLLQ